VVTVKPYLTPDLSEPRRVARYDQRHLAWHDLDLIERTEVSDDRKAGLVLVAIAMFLVWVLGQVAIGEPALDPIQTPAAYSHPEPTEEVAP
jgi:hypothetical protein